MEKRLILHNKQGEMKPMARQDSMESWSGEGDRRTGSTWAWRECEGKKVMHSKWGLNREV